MIQDLSDILDLLVGPYGVVAVQAVVIFFLWRLYREATAEARKSQEATSALTGAVNSLVDEFKQWRESYRDFMMGLAGMKGKDGA